MTNQCSTNNFHLLVPQVLSELHYVFHEQPLTACEHMIKPDLHSAIFSVQKVWYLVMLGIYQPLQSYFSRTADWKTASQRLRCQSFKIGEFGLCFFAE